METTLFKAATGFPREMLLLSVQAREEYFKSHLTGHDYLLRAYKAVEASVFMSTLDGAVYRVFGPAGVGKSTIAALLEKRCYERMTSCLAHNPGRLACLRCKVPKYERGFDWADFYRRMLILGAEQLVDNKVPLPDRNNMDPCRKIPFVETKRLAGLRQSFENLLKNRRPAAVLLDEAQHLGHVTGSRSLHDQHDILKSLAEETGVPFVLFGTYELVHFTGMSGQLARRGTRTHIERYHGHDQNEMKMFQKVVLDFQEHLPLQVEPDLLANWAYLYEGSLGLIGVLKVWLQRALNRTLSPQNKEDAKCEGSISLSLLQRTALDTGARQELLKLASEGEQLLADEANEDDLNTQLWNSPLDTNRARRSSKTAIRATQAKSNNRKVGQRTAIRDEIGEVHLTVK